MRKFIVFVLILMVLAGLAFLFWSFFIKVPPSPATEAPIEEFIQIYDIEEGYLTVPAIQGAKKHSFNWDNLKYENGFLRYEDDNYSSELGVDVSTYQGEIDWNAVKQQGIDFAILRIGFRGYGESGKLVLDERYLDNVTKATEAGIKVGVYFFSQAINEEEAREEAQFVLENIQNHLVEFPICYDLEKIKYDDSARANNLSKEQRTQNAIAFCEEIKQSGYTPMLYANAKWLTTELDLIKLQEYDVWYADYQEKPLFPYNFTIWQYTESAQVDGISRKY